MDEVSLRPDSDSPARSTGGADEADTDLAPRQCCDHGFGERLRDSPSSASAGTESADVSGAESNEVDCYGGRVASGVISDALEEAAIPGGNPRSMFAFGSQVVYDLYQHSLHRFCIELLIVFLM